MSQVAPVKTASLAAFGAWFRAFDLGLFGRSVPWLWSI